MELTFSILFWILLLIFTLTFFLWKETPTKTPQRDRRLEKPPKELGKGLIVIKFAVKNGTFNYGTFDAPILKLNILDAHTHWHPFTPLKNFRLKEWLVCTENKRNLTF